MCDDFELYSCLVVRQVKAVGKEPKTLVVCFNGATEEAKGFGRVASSPFASGFFVFNASCEC